MTVQELLDIAKAEGSNPEDLFLVIAIGGTYFALVTSDEQDRFNPNYVVMAITEMPKGME